MDTLERSGSRSVIQHGVFRVVFLKYGFVRKPGIRETVMGLRG